MRGERKLGHKVLTGSTKEGTGWCRECGTVTWSPRHKKWEHHAHFVIWPDIETDPLARPADDHPENDDIFDSVR